MVKKIRTMIVVCAMMVFSLAMTASAASYMTLTGSLSGSKASGTLKNISSTARYGNVVVRHFDTASSKTTIGSNGRAVSAGASIGASGTVTKSHADTVGDIYKSSSPSSGVAQSVTKTIK